MYMFINQELSHQHQEALLREARTERLLRPVHKQRTSQPVHQAALQPGSSEEPDFAAIRRDLRSTLSEWHLETGTESFETMIDTFMRRLKIRLHVSEQRHETKVTP